MGFRFEVEHANFVAYVTSEKGRKAPRCAKGELLEFLYSIGNREEIHRNTISTDPNWQQQLQRAAYHLAGVVDRTSKELLFSEEVAKYLDQLRSFFTGYDLCVLIIAGDKEAYCEKLFRNFVERSKVDILVLMPYGAKTFVNIVDPFPALQALVATPITPPLVVFWTRLQNAIALPLSDAEAFYEKNVATKPALKETIDSVILREAKKRQAKQILHISDLHFGDPTANGRKNYLKQHLGSIASKVDRVVISGDLFNEPKQDYRSIFDEFNTDLQEWTQKPPIFVPGNHDVRVKGNEFYGFGRSTDQFVDIGFDPVVVDEELKAVFFCFNSCEAGNFATGFVGDQQRTDRGTVFETLIRKQPNIEAYARIAIVHHHPYTYAAKPTVFYEKLLAAFSKKEDRFIAFENADAFLNWCGARDVSLILHGHKHVPHVVMAEIEVRKKPREIMIVGCGSSTGIERKPMCYDIVSLDPRTGRWNVSFYSDLTGDGAGFDLQNITLDFRTQLPSQE